MWETEVMEPDRFRHGVDIDWAMENANKVNSTVRDKVIHNKIVDSEISLASIALELNLIRRLFYGKETGDTRE